MSLEEAVSSLCKELTCPICMELFTDPSSIGCGHNFCHACLLEAFQAKPQCPLCKVPGFKRDIAKNLNLTTIVNIAKQIQASQSTQRKGTPTKRPSGGRVTASVLDSEIATVERQLAENADLLQRVSSEIADLRNQEVDPNSQRSARPSAPVFAVPAARPARTKTPEQSQDSVEEILVERPPPKSPSRAAAKPSRAASVERDDAEPPPPPPSVAPPAKSKKGAARPKRAVPPRDPFAFTSSAEVDASRQNTRPPSPSLPHFSDDEPPPPPPKLARRSSSAASSQQSASQGESQAVKATPAAAARRPRGNKRPLILLTGFGQPNPKEREMTEAITSLGGRIAPSWVSGITHVVLPKQERAARTMKYLHGVVSGAWMVTKAWLDASAEAGQWADEEPYEVASDSFAPGAPRHFRLRVASGAPGVFHKDRFLLWGDFRNPAPDKAELRRLIEMAGGTVVNRADEGVRVICDPLLTPADRKKVLKVADVPLTSDYILDCISFCSLEPQERHCVVDN